MFFIHPGRVFSPVLFLLAGIPDKTEYPPIVDKIVEKLLIKNALFSKLFCILYLREREASFRQNVVRGMTSLFSAKKSLLTSGWQSSNRLPGCIIGEQARATKKSLFQNYLSYYFGTKKITQQTNHRFSSPLCETRMQHRNVWGQARRGTETCEYQIRHFNTAGRGRAAKRRLMGTGR